MLSKPFLMFYHLRALGLISNFIIDKACLLSDSIGAQQDQVLKNHKPWLLKLFYPSQKITLVSLLVQKEKGKYPHQTAQRKTGTPTPSESAYGKQCSPEKNTVYYPRKHSREQANPQPATHTEPQTRNFPQIIQKEIKMKEEAAIAKNIYFGGQGSLYRSKENMAPAHRHTLDTWRVSTEASPGFFLGTIAVPTCGAECRKGDLEVKAGFGPSAQSFSGLNTDTTGTWAGPKAETLEAKGSVACHHHRMWM
ncbi:uncharacterized protein [Symphalangus syndactylus]|uniref:uncharacterized protein n=1 Tax=Symphalangus syndactylus TaxID=9590 RepID=UPI003007C6AE